MFLMNLDWTALNFILVQTLLDIIIVDTTIYVISQAYD